MSTNVNSPLPVFLAADGPIGAGNLYIGQANFNPVTTQETVFWDTALTIKAQQPLKVINGYVVNPSSNQPAPFFTFSDTYSVLLQDSNTLLTILSLPSISGAASSSTVTKGSISVVWSPGNGIVVPTDSSGSNRVTGQTAILSLFLGAATIPPSTAASNATMANNTWRIATVTSGPGLTLSPPSYSSTSVSWSVSDLTTASSYFQPSLVYKDANGIIYEIGPVRLGAVQQRYGAQGNTGAAGAPGVNIDIGGVGGITYDPNTSTFSPASVNLSALVNGISNAYTTSWNIQGATPTTATTTLVAITPESGTNAVTATLNVTDAVTGTTYSKIVNLPIVKSGLIGLPANQYANPSIFQWTTSANPPTAPTENSVWDWYTGTFTPPSGWSSSIPVTTTPGSYLWEITAPLTGFSGTTTSTIAWNAFPTACTGYNGLNGASGPRSTLLNLYQWGANAPTTFPTGTTTVTWATGAFTLPTTPNGWAIEANPAGIVAGSKLWQLTQYVADSLTTPTSTFSWTAATPVPIGQAGAAGAPGQRTTSISLFQWSATPPTNFPSGTSSFSWSTGIYSAPSISAAGWSVYPGDPVPGSKLWQISAYYSDNLTTGTSTISWTGAFATIAAVGTSPANGISALVVKLYQRTTTNTAPAVTSSGTATYNFNTNTISNGPGGAWLTSVPNTTGDYLWEIQAQATTQAAVLSFSIPNSFWSVPALSSKNGTSGTNYLIVTAYQWGSFQPSLPSVDTEISLVSGAIAGLNNGWSVDSGNTADGNLYTARAFIRPNPGTTTATILANQWRYGGVIAAPGKPGSASFVVVRQANDGSAPTNAEINAVIGRNYPVQGDEAVVNYNGGLASNAYIYSVSGWGTQTPWVAGNLIIPATIDNTKLTSNFVLTRAISVGGQPVRTGTTMTGSGVVVDGTFGTTAIGDTNSNFVFDGTNTFLTGTKVSSGDASFSTDSVTGEINFTGNGTLITSGGQFGAGRAGEFIAFDGETMHSRGLLSNTTASALENARIFPSNSVNITSYKVVASFGLTKFAKQVLVTMNFGLRVGLTPAGLGFSTQTVYWDAPSGVLLFALKNPGQTTFSFITDSTPTRNGQCYGVQTNGTSTGFNKVWVPVSGSFSYLMNNLKAGAYEIAALFNRGILAYDVLGQTNSQAPVADDDNGSTISTQANIQIIY